MPSLVGSEMCIRDRVGGDARRNTQLASEIQDVAHELEHGVPELGRKRVPVVKEDVAPRARERLLHINRRLEKRPGQLLNRKTLVGGVVQERRLADAVDGVLGEAVSYTHLTLPTNREV